MDDELAGFIEQHDGTVVDARPEHQSMRARVPLAALESVAGLDAVQTVHDAAWTASIDQAESPSTVVSEGDSAHRSDEARQTYGVDGTGISIAVVFDGIRHLERLQGRGELPPHVTVLPGYRGRSGGRAGTLALEVLHDVAPGADLYFAGIDVPVGGYAAAVRSLHEMGVDIIVDGINVFDEPAFQHGTAALAYREVAEKGTLLFISSGNEGNVDSGTAGTWEGDYRAGALATVGNVSNRAVHYFDADTYANRLTAKSAHGAWLKWSDPDHASSNDYDLFVVGRNGVVVARSTTLQSGSQRPFERIWTPVLSGYSLVVVKYSGDARYLHLMAYRGGLTHSTPGAVWGPNALPEAFSIAAVENTDSGRASTTHFSSANKVAGLSSDGPRRIFYDDEGDAITPGSLLAAGGRVINKPDFAGAHRVSTAMPGLSSYPGTSAAAAHVAGIAALMLEAAGGPDNITRAEVEQALKDSAIDIASPGHDRNSGYGIVQALEAVAAVHEASRNRAPEIVAEPDDLIESVDVDLALDLAPYVSDPDGDELAVAVSLEKNSGTIASSLTGTVVTFSGGEGSKARVHVSYEDPGGFTRHLRFGVAFDPAVDTDTALSALTMTGVDLTGFSSAGRNYAGNVPYQTTATTVSATTDSTSATVEILGDDNAPVASTESSTATSTTYEADVALQPGPNRIRIRVSATDARTTTYAVTVTRSAPSAAEDARLRALVLRDVALDGFDRDVYEYRAPVGSDVATTVVGATPLQESATIEITPPDANTQAAGHQVELAEGANEIRVTVTAADETTTRAYVVTVTRAAVPAVTLTADGESVTEGAEARFTATLSEELSEPLTVPVTLTSAGAVPRGAAPASVTFAAGETAATLVVATADDRVVEGDGMVTVSLVAGDGYALGEASVARVTVADDDVAAWAVTAAPSEIAEGGSATVTVSIGNGVTYAWAQQIGLSVGGAVSASDYTLSPEALTLAAGVSTATATLMALDDAEGEPAEAAVVTAGVDGETLGSAVVTVLASDLSTDASLSSLSLSGVDIGAFDPDATSYAGLVAHAVAVTTVLATPADEGASAVIDPPDADGNAGGHQVALAVGDNRIIATVLAADGETERAYTVTVTRASAPAVTLTADAESVTEGTAAAFTATLSGSLSASLTVPVSVTSEGDVLSGSPPASLTFQAGETVATLAVATDDDLLVEGDGSVTVTLTAGAGYALGDATVARVTVTDDDVASWTVTAEPAEVEEGGSATVTVSIGNGVTYATDQAIGLSVAGEVTASDYTLSASSLALAAGASAVSATLRALEDGASEGEERATVTAVLDGAEIGTASVTFDDAVPLSLPVVSGVPQVGQALTALLDAEPSKRSSDGGTSGGAATVRNGPTKASSAGVPVSYLWLRDGEEIAGATDTRYVLTASDAGAQVSVRVTRGGRTATSAWTIPVWGAPYRPPLGADEEELLGTMLTVGWTGAYPLPLGGYGRMERASFGSLDDTVLRVDGSEYGVTLVALNDGYYYSQFALGTEPTVADTRGWSVYWDGYRIDGLRLQRSSPLWLARAPQSKDEYKRYFRGLSDGVRVSVSIRRALPPPVASVSAVSDSVVEGSVASFEVRLDRAPSTSLSLGVSVTSSGEVVSGEPAGSVTVLAGRATATLEVPTDDDLVVEEDGSVTATLVAGAGYTLGESSTATVTVSDDDAATFTVTAAPSEIAEGGSATVTVTVVGGVTFATGQTLDLSVTGEVSATDYALEPGTLDLEAGTQTVTSTFEAVVDAVDEALERARIGVVLDGAEVGSATVQVRDASTAATLTDLSLTEVDIGEFDSERTTYAGTAAPEVSSTTVTALPSDANASVAISDASGSTSGTQRTSALVLGSNEIAATVTAEDATTSRTYTVTVTRLPAWGTRVPERDIALEGVEATGVWSDGTTLWASSSDGESALAYDLSTGARLAARDIALTAQRYETTALWSHGGTLWVANWRGEAVAYRLSDGERLSSSDLDGMLSSAGNNAPVGLWSNGSVLYVVDRADRHLYAYASDGVRLAGREFGLFRGDRSQGQWGLWSDGETVLTSGTNGYAVAYRLSDGARLADRDIDLGMTGYGLWSDGETLWVSDSQRPRLVAYAVPGLGRPTGSGLLPVVVTNRAEGVPSSSPGAAVAIADAGLRAAIATALGKSTDDPVGINELRTLRSLDARGAGITDLGGLASAVHLEALDLGDNPLMDLRVLGSLPHLTMLNLDATGADPWSLAGLTGLQRLSLRGNGIEDLAGLSSLASLKALDVANNAVADLSPLSGLANLRVLSLRGNAVQDLRALAALPRLLELDVTDNRIGDFGRLAGNGRLTVQGRDAQAVRLED